MCGVESIYSIYIKWIVIINHMCGVNSKYINKTVMCVSGIGNTSGYYYIYHIFPTSVMCGESNIFI